MAIPRIGGSFAPAITEGKLTRYAELIASLPRESPLTDALKLLLRCAQRWWELPESDAKGSEHPTRRATIVPLTDQLIADLWDDVPWDHELTAITPLLEEITERELRDAAFHLLWFAWELFRDREPLTTDRLIDG